IEGIEGGGKTTQVGLLAAALERAKLAVRVTREPGGTKLGEEVRALLLHSSASIGRLAELFLILADRAEHVESLIQPALRAGQVVLCDRFADSTLAYQAYGRELPLDAVRRVESVARQGLLPDLTFVLDCPIDIGLARTRKRRGHTAADRFEGEGASFHERVRQGFLALAREDPGRIRVIDGTRAADDVHREIFAVSAERLGVRTP
ncbi:MAG TPA: dTMP kinase, partial [Candidatus Binatia bacterium]|nr:dTMP kinase [Candidatus Binatia bacterium]